MWVFKYPGKAFKVWLSHWVCLADTIVAILTFCTWQPHWFMSFICWDVKRNFRKKML